MSAISETPLNCFVDTHTHIDLTSNQLKRGLDFGIFRSEVVDSMSVPLGARFDGCVHVCCSLSTISEAFSLAESAGDDMSLRMAFGVHPHEASTYSDEAEEQLIAAIRKVGERAVAVGECGLDYHYMNSTREQQIEAFRRQVRLSVEILKLPLVVHTREADDDTLAVLRELLPPSWPVHIHCFTGTPEFANQLLQLSDRLCIGFTGVSTFKSATTVHETIRQVPLDRMLLETDAPYMAPVPLRGKSCHSGMIPYVARRIAELKGTSIDETYQIIRENTRRLYGF